MRCIFPWALQNRGCISRTKRMWERMKPWISRQQEKGAHRLDGAREQVHHHSVVLQHHGAVQRRDVALHAAVTNGGTPVSTFYIATGTLPNIRNTLNTKSTRHSGPRIAANSYESLRIAENRRNSIPYPGPYPLKYHEFKKRFAWTDFLYSVAYPYM